LWRYMEWACGTACLLVSNSQWENLPHAHSCSASHPFPVAPQGSDEIGNWRVAQLWSPFLTGVFFLPLVVSYSVTVAYGHNNITVKPTLLLLLEPVDGNRRSVSFVLRTQNVVLLISWPLHWHNVRQIGLDEN
jgi:hypothetical protein